MATQIVTMEIILCCQASEGRQWMIQSLAEQVLCVVGVAGGRSQRVTYLQVEILETILLYYKDFVHRSPDLLSHAHCLHGYGFGVRQNSKVSLVEGAGLLQQHIG